MKAARLLAITLLLQARGKMTATELAQELEVSERTIYRDIVSLETARVPVVAGSGPDGGYWLPEGYRLDPTTFSGDEAASLAIGGAILQGMRETALAATLQQALARMEAALPPEYRPGVRAGRERFLFDTSRWYGNAGTPEQHLPVLRAAVLHGRRVRLLYPGRDAAQSEWRDVDPLGLVYKAGIWYLVGHCLRREALRTFRVGRIEAVEELGIPRAEYPDFDLGRYWEQSRAQVELRGHCPVVLRVSPCAMEALLNRQVSIVRSVRHADGAHECEVDFDSYDWAVSFVLGFGPGLEVLAPPEVRAAVARAAAATAALHGVAP